MQLLIHYYLRQVVNGEATVGDFVTMNVYIVQLFQPLNFLGTIYGAVVDATEDMNNLLDILANNPDVQDVPGARKLYVCRWCPLSFFLHTC